MITFASLPGLGRFRHALGGRQRFVPVLIGLALGACGGGAGDGQESREAGTSVLAGASRTGLADGTGSNAAGGAGADIPVGGGNASNGTGSEATSGAASEVSNGAGDDRETAQSMRPVLLDPDYNPAFDQTDRIGGGLAIVPAYGIDDYRPAGFETLVFADEFDGEDIDRSRWCTRFSWGGGPPLQVPDDQCAVHGQGTLDFVNDEWQRYRDFNQAGETLHALGNGVLALRATKNTDDPRDRSFEGAMLRSKLTFRPDAGERYYFTVRVRLPSARGTWPMIWLAPGLDANGDSQWPPEIDILEAPLNDETETIYNLYQHLQIHRNQTESGTHEYLQAHPAYNTEWGYWKSINSLRDIWLEIGTQWSADSVCYYVNGVELACERYRWVDNDGNVANPANLLINMAIGGQWPGRNGLDLARFPVKMELDHVRVYRN